MTLRINDDQRFGQGNRIVSMDEAGRVGQRWYSNVVLLLIPQSFITAKNKDAVCLGVDLDCLNLTLEDAATLLSLNAKMGTDMSTGPTSIDSSIHSDAFSAYGRDYAELMARAIAREHGIGDKDVVVNALLKIANTQRSYKEVLQAFTLNVDVNAEVKPFVFHSLRHPDFNSEHYCIIADDAQLNFICNDIGAQLRLATEFYGTICLGRVSQKQTRDSIFTYLASAVSKTS